METLKHIVDSHRGEIKVTRQPGKGSRFIVVLPKERILEYRNFNNSDTD